MGYPIWFIQIITQRGWKFKRETKRYKVYQSPISVDRIIVHKKRILMNGLFGVTYVKLGWKKQRFKP